MVSILSTRRPLSRRHSSGTQQQLQDKSDKAFGGLRHPSRTCPARKLLRDFRAKMRTVFERVFLESDAEHVIIEAVQGIGKVDPPGFPTVFVEQVWDKVCTSLGSSAANAFTGKFDPVFWKLMLTSACMSVGLATDPTSPAILKSKQLSHQWRANKHSNYKWLYDKNGYLAKSEISPHRWQRLYRVVRRLELGNGQQSRTSGQDKTRWVPQEACSSSTSFAAVSMETSQILSGSRTPEGATLPKMLDIEDAFYTLSLREQDRGHRMGMFHEAVLRHVSSCVDLVQGGGVALARASFGRPSCRSSASSTTPVIAFIVDSWCCDSVLSIVSKINWKKRRRYLVIAKGTVAHVSSLVHGGERQRHELSCSHSYSSCFDSCFQQTSSKYGDLVVDFFRCVFDVFNLLCCICLSSTFSVATCPLVFHGPLEETTIVPSSSRELFEGARLALIECVCCVS